MKRLRLIGMQAERGALLKLLQHMGCVEIDEPTEFRDDPVWASLTRPDTQALGRAREQRSELEGALKTLKKYGPRQKGGLLKARPVITEGELFDDRAYEATLDDAGRLGELERQISALYAEQNKPWPPGWGWTSRWRRPPRRRWRCSSAPWPARRIWTPWSRPWRRRAS